MITSGFLDPNGYTLAAGRGYFGASYAGTDVVAQLGEGDDRSLPLVVHGAYGVTDQFTLGFGVGIWTYDIDLGLLGPEAGTEVYPYLSPKFRVFESGPLSASLGGRAVFETSGALDGILFGVSSTISAGLGGRAAGHLSLGVHGQTGNIGDAGYLIGVGGDVELPLSTDDELELFGDVRVFDLEGERAEVLIAGLRFLGGTLASEVGIANWFRDGFEIRPIVSLAYRF